MSIHLSYDTIDQAWPDLVDRAKLSSPIKSRNGDQRELEGMSIRIIRPEECWLWNADRGANPVYAAAELLWYLSWTNDGEQIAAYAPSYRSYLNSNGVANGAYGHRWKDQFPPLLKMLEQEPWTRQAVMGAWNHSDIESPATPDCPCTLTLQFLLRDDRLNLVTTMRSNDLWLGFPYDVWCFTSIQKLVAQHLSVELGWYQHQVGSLHLYDKDSKRVNSLRQDDGPMIVNLSLEPGNVEKDIRAATSMEKMCREDKPPKLGVLAESLESCGLRMTILGQAIAACWLRWSDETDSIGPGELGAVLDDRIAPNTLEAALRMRQRNSTREE